MAPRTTSILTSRPRHHPTATRAYIARLHITDAQDCCASSALLGTGADKTRHLARNSGDPAPPRPSKASRIRTAAQDRRLATQAASLLCCRRHRHHSGLPSPTAPTPATPDSTYHSPLFPRVACSPALVTNGKLRGTPSPSDKGLGRSQPASGRGHPIITYFCPVGLAQTSVLTPKTPHRTQCAIVRGLSCQLWLSCVPCLRLPLSYPSWARRGYGCWRRGCKLMAGGKSWRQLTAMTSACRTDTHTLCRGVERCRTAFLVGCFFARRACHVAGK